MDFRHINILTHCGLATPYGTKMLVNFCSCNDFLSDGMKPLFKPTFTYSLSMGFCNVHQGWIDMKSIHLLNFKIAHSKLSPYIPENKDLIGLTNLGKFRVIIHLQNAENYKFGDKLSHSEYIRGTTNQTWGTMRSKGKFQRLSGYI